MISIFASAQPFQKLKIIPEKIGEGLYDFYVVNPNFCPVQLSLQFTELANMVASCELPYVGTIQPGKHKIFDIMRTYLDIPGSFKYDFQTQPGAYPVIPNTTVTFHLPIANNKTTKAIAFDFSKSSTPNRIAWDFEMAAGDSVMVCNSGVVCAVTETQTRDTLRVGDNTVTIFHTDGTFGKYEFLADQSICVKLGDSIKTGDAIGVVRSEKIRSLPQCRFSVYYVNARVDSILANKMRNFYTFIDPLFDTKNEAAIHLEGKKVYAN